jgi:hypothetical protein
MGLDMYLQGHLYRSTDQQTIEDFPVKEIIVELGYWRKHANLHGAIVQTFADGVDNCEPIELSRDDIEKLIEMVKANDLPHTQGFFFGESAKPGDQWFDEEQAETIKQLENALKWYDNETADGGYRWVTYRASW